MSYFTATGAAVTGTGFIGTGFIGTGHVDAVRAWGDI